MLSYSSYAFVQPQGISVHPHLSSQDVPDDVNQLFQLFTRTDPPLWLTSGWYPSVDDDHIHVLRALSNHYTIHLTESPPTIAPHFFRTIPLLARAVHDLQLLPTSSRDSARSGRNTTIVVTFLAQILHALFPTGTVEYKALYATCLDICLSRLPLAPLFRRSDIVDLAVAYEAPPTDPADGQIQHEAVGELESLKRKASSSIDSCSCDGLKRRRNGSTSLAARSYASSSDGSYSTAPSRSVPRLPSITMSEYLAGPPVYTEPDSSEDLYLHADGEFDAPNAGLSANFFFDYSTPTRIPVLCTASHDKIYGVMSSALFARRENGISTPLVGFSFNRTRPEIQVVIGWMEGYESECPQVHVRHATPDSSSILCGAFCLADPIASISLVIALERLAREYLQPDQVLCKELCQSKRSEQPQGRFNWRADFARSGPAEGWTAEKLRAWIDGIPGGGDDTCIPTSFPPASTRCRSRSLAEKSTSPSKMAPRQSRSQASEKKTHATRSSASKGSASNSTTDQAGNTTAPPSLPKSLPNSVFARSRSNRNTHWRHHVAQLESLLLTHSLLPPWATGDKPVEDLFHLPIRGYHNIAGRLPLKEFLKVREAMEKNRVLESDAMDTLQRHVDVRDKAALPALWLAEPLDDVEVALIASIFPRVLDLHTIKGLFEGSSEFELLLEATTRRPWDDIESLVCKDILLLPKAHFGLSGTIQSLPERFVHFPLNQFFKYINSHKTMQHSDRVDNPPDAYIFCMIVEDHFSQFAREELDAATRVLASCVSDVLKQFPAKRCKLSPKQIISNLEKSGDTSLISIFTPLWQISEAAIKLQLHQVPKVTRVKLQIALVNLLAARAHKTEIDSVANDWVTSTKTSLEDARKISASRVVYQPRRSKADFAAFAYYPRIEHNRYKPLLKAFNTLNFKDLDVSPTTDDTDNIESMIPATEAFKDDSIFSTCQNDATIAQLLADQDVTPESIIASAGHTTVAVPANTKREDKGVVLNSSSARVNADDLSLPYFAREHKTENNEPLTPVAQLRSHLHGSTTQLAATGIYNFPVFGLAARGYQGVLTCAWAEHNGVDLTESYSELDITHILERHCLSFTLTQILGVFDYTVFLILLHRRHVLALERQFAAVEEELLKCLEKGNISDWKMESQRKYLETLQEDWKLTKEQIQHYSSVPIGAKGPISMEVPSAVP